jgi:hypothetical protein
MLPQRMAHAFVLKVDDSDTNELAIYRRECDRADMEDPSRRLLQSSRPSARKRRSRFRTRESAASFPEQFLERGLHFYMPTRLLTWTLNLGTWLSNILSDSLLSTLTCRFSSRTNTRQPRAFVGQGLLWDSTMGRAGGRDARWA